MGEKPELFAELVRQTFIAEGEKYDEAVRSWQEGIDLSFGEDERVPEPVLEPAPVPSRADLSLPDEPASSRIIGEDDRRRVLHQEISRRGPGPDSDAEARRYEDYEFADFLRST
jgi:hypothetical protein